MSGSGWLLVGVGAGTVLVAAVDATWTTLWAGRGGGPLTQVLTVGLRRAAAPLARRRRWVLTTFGPVTIVAVVALWVVLLWAGFALVFAADPDAVVATATRQPADVVDRVYFVGYTLFTQGNGEYVPSEGPWQITTNVVNLVGFVSLTLAVTYFVPVVSAASHRRSFASSVLGLGEDGGELLAHGWDGSKVDLGDHFLSFSTELSTIVQRHFAYPVLHSFHPGESAGVHAAGRGRTRRRADPARIRRAAPPTPVARLPTLPAGRHRRLCGDAAVELRGGGRRRSADPRPGAAAARRRPRPRPRGRDRRVRRRLAAAPVPLGLLHNEQLRWPSARSEGGAQE